MSGAHEVSGVGGGSLIAIGCLLSARDVACLDDSWKPRVPIFYENGQKDQASTIDPAHTMVESIESQLMLTGGDEIAGDGHYTGHALGRRPGHAVCCDETPARS